jgi:hypothetical protein
MWFVNLVLLLFTAEGVEYVTLFPDITSDTSDTSDTINSETNNLIYRSYYAPLLKIRIGLCRSIRDAKDPIPFLINLSRLRIR